MHKTIVRIIGIIYSARIAYCTEPTVLHHLPYLYTFIQSIRTYKSCELVLFCYWHFEATTMRVEYFLAILVLFYDIAALPITKYKAPTVEMMAAASGRISTVTVENIPFGSERFFLFNMTICSTSSFGMHFRSLLDCSLLCASDPACNTFNLVAESDKVCKLASVGPGYGDAADSEGGLFIDMKVINGNFLLHFYTVYLTGICPEHLWQFLCLFRRTDHYYYLNHYKYHNN